MADGRGGDGTWDRVARTQGWGHGDRAPKTNCPQSRGPSQEPRIAQQKKISLLFRKSVWSFPLCVPIIALSRHDPDFQLKLTGDTPMNKTTWVTKRLAPASGSAGRSRIGKDAVSCSRSWGYRPLDEALYRPARFLPIASLLLSRDLCCRCRTQRGK